MARLRFWCVALLALAFAGNATQTARTSGQDTAAPTFPYYSQAAVPTAAPESACVIYALGDMGYDAGLGKWIAETIPDVIEPGTWKGTGALRYYAPKNILVVNHSSAVQAKVERFLKDVKTSLPKGHAAAFATAHKATPDTVVPAAYRQAVNAPEPSGYPVPAPVKAPKHLFHFLIRYEGDGIIDDNVVKYIKAQMQGEKNGKSASVPLALPGLLSVVPNAPTPPNAASYGTTGSPMSPAVVPAPAGEAPPTTEDKPTGKKEKTGRQTASYSAPSVSPMNSSGAWGRSAGGVMTGSVGSYPTPTVAPAPMSDMPPAERLEAPPKEEKKDYEPKRSR